MQVGVLIFGILVGGFVFGSLARLIVPGGRRLTLSETTLIGIAGSGVGAIVMNMSTPDTSTTDFRWWTLLGMLLGAVLVLGAVLLLMNVFGWRSGDFVARSARELIAAGEGHSVEFKQTARWNVHARERDARMELAVAKTVVGFLNSDGGTLIVGVDDDGRATGLDDDLRLMKEPDLDRFELWLTDHLERCLGGPAVANVSVTFETLAGATVCRVEMDPAPEPVFLDEPGGNREADMYVRMGNSTRRLLTDEAMDYARHHWAGRGRRS